MTRLEAAAEHPRGMRGRNSKGITYLAPCPHFDESIALILEESKQRATQQFGLQTCTMNIRATLRTRNDRFGTE